MTIGARKDPYNRCNFLLEIEGLRVGGFTEVSGLEAQIEFEEYQEGGVNGYVHRLPGPVKYSSPIVLRKGLTDQLELWEWFVSTSRGRIVRKSGSIILRDMTGREKMRWNFIDALPAKWTGPAFSADSSDIAIESVELIHHGLMLDSVRESGVS